MMEFSAERLTWQYVEYLLPEDGSAHNASPLPEPRVGASLTYIPLRSSLFLYGGEGADGSPIRDGMWEFDLRGRTWTRHAGAPGSDARRYHSATLVKNNIYVLGGGVGAVDVFDTGIILVCAAG